MAAGSAPSLSGAWPFDPHGGDLWAMSLLSGLVPAMIADVVFSALTAFSNKAKGRVNNNVTPINL